MRKDWNAENRLLARSHEGGGEKTMRLWTIDKLLKLLMRLAPHSMEEITQLGVIIFARGLR
jgi:hypothetical protein